MKLKTVLALAVSATFLGLGASANAKDPSATPDAKTKAAYPGAEYPVPGRVEGTTAFIHEDEAPRKSNKKYPPWFRGNGANGLADKDSIYWYTELIAPAAYKTHKGLSAEGAYCGTLELAKGETYPAHNHPASEFYFILDGSAEWHVDDEKKKVKPGDMIYHRPYSAHGWTNLSKTKPLKALYCWWREPSDKVDVMNYSAGWINPDRFTSRASLVPNAIPVPPVRPAAK